MTADAEEVLPHAVDGRDLLPLGGGREASHLVLALLHWLL